ncbi:lymphocyte antigen 6 family member pge isoform X1 [Poecilia reticulata]|uniref:lymphocyte antigen 6 family member pge isoform X1 n=1 Tax=Poecilia reticulata TaxID=8081 RepID=UPI0004A30366|nr:PREDICTED: urokinase plasminogen activator surface receptor-like isoform X1 [Poecilia reticulata]
MHYLHNQTSLKSISRASDTTNKDAANWSLNGEALKCYTCMGSNNDNCNQQGSKSCPSYSDACAVVVGHDSGVMKSCSYKSFCSQVSSQGYRAPGVRVHCCYSDDCNIKSFASPLPGFSYWLLSLLLLLH